MLHRLTRSSAGFTLIEILIVVAIISLLAGMLFPVFARARGNGRRSSCQSNLRQLSLAALQYTQDYDDRFPFGFVIEGEKEDGSPNYLVTLDLVQPYIHNTQVAICPADDKDKPSLDLMLPGVAATSYTVNDLIFNSLDWKGVSPATLAQISRTSEMPLIWDAKNVPLSSDDAEIQVDKRHFDGANVAFADGHVKWTKTKPLLSDDNLHWNAKPEAD